MRGVPAALIDMQLTRTAQLDWNSISGELHKGKQAQG
jgi:hypothetical protein